MKRLLIRGARLLQQISLLTEASYAELENKTKTFTPTTTKRQHATDIVRVTKMELTPARESGILSIKAVVHSGDKDYTTIVVFDGVDYSDDDQAGNTSFIGVGNEEHHIIPVPLIRSNCKVSCDCLDFYWRFATQNARVNSLAAKPPPPYNKRTNRPPANIKNTPGVCKHIIKTIIVLRDNNIVS